MSDLTKEELSKLIHEENWSSITKKNSPESLVEIFDYQECMALAYHLFFKNFRDDHIPEFAVQLLFSIRDKYITEWNNDWKNDVFLGQLCGLTWRYNEEYVCHKRAYNKLKDPPDSLLLLLAGCSGAPGTPPISDQESEIYLKRAIEKKITYESAVMMRGLSRDKNDQKQEKYWDTMCQELKKNNIHTDPIIPNVLKDKIESAN